MLSPCRIQVSRPVLALVTLGLTSCASSDSDVTAPPESGGTPSTHSVYTVQPVSLISDVFSDGHPELTYGVTVTDSAGALVAGAGIVFGASAGTVSPTVAFSDAKGTASVFWVLTPQERAGQAAAELRACAGPESPPDCTPSTITTFRVED